MDAAAVAEQLGLGDVHRLWLAALAAAGPPVPAALPRGSEAAVLLARLGVTEPDLTAILEALPDPERQPALWWLLERCVERVARDVGRPDGTGPWPALPAALGVQGRCFWVSVFLASMPFIRSWHAARGVPDDVSWATLADLGQHVGLYRWRNGSTGFDSQFWLAIHFRGGLYALGRLQFTPYRLRTGPAGPLFWYDEATIERLGPGVRPGDPVLGVHIPATGPLTPEACDDSLRRAGTFFADHIPEAHGSVATCTSWLMDDQLAAYLPAGSNIISFQRRFELVPGARDADAETFGFVFGRLPASLDELTPRTQLERALVGHVRAGGHWRMRTGWLRV
jgi:hypothetical protein